MVVRGDTKLTTGRTQMTSRWDVRIGTVEIHQQLKSVIIDDWFSFVVCLHDAPRVHICVKRYVIRCSTSSRVTSVSQWQDGDSKHGQRTGLTAVGMWSCPRVNSLCSYGPTKLAVPISSHYPRYSPLFPAAIFRKSLSHPSVEGPVNLAFSLTVDGQDWDQSGSMASTRGLFMNQPQFFPCMKPGPFHINLPGIVTKNKQ